MSFRSAFFSGRAYRASSFAFTVCFSKKSAHLQYVCACVGVIWYRPKSFCFGSTWHLLVPPAVFIVLNTVSYRRGLFAAMERTDESKKSLGTVYYAVSMTVMAALCLAAPRCLPCYAMGLFCMALGDGFAPIFGAVKRGNRRIFKQRTLYGSLSVLVLCLLVVVVVNALFGMGLPFWAELSLAVPDIRASKAGPGAAADSSAGLFCP